MRNIKAFEGFISDKLNKDNPIIRDLISKYSNHHFDLKVTHGMDDTISAYCYAIDNIKIYGYNQHYTVISGHTYDWVKVFIDNVQINASKKLEVQLLNIIESIYENTKSFISMLLVKYSLQYTISEQTKSRKELIDKLDEFEVIKDDGSIDMISLNSLFDYYNTPFDEERLNSFIKNIIKHKVRYYQ